MSSVSAASGSGARSRLTRDRVVAGAVELADAIGVADLTIRRLAEHLGTKPMTLYHHVANKDAILDAMVDSVYAEIGLPPSDTDWRSAVRRRCEDARAVFVRHPWAVSLMDSRRSPGDATLAHLDALLACFLGSGFSPAATAHAVAVIDAYVYGFALQEAALPATGGHDMHDLAAELAIPADRYPNLARFTAEHVLQPGYDFADEFEVGLDLVLDGVADLIEQEPSGRSPGA